MPVNVSTANRKLALVESTDRFRNVTKQKSTRLGQISVEEAENLMTRSQVIDRGGRLAEKGVDYVWEHAGRYWRCRYSGRCKTCRHEQGEEINRLLFLQIPHADILKLIGEDPEAEGALTKHNLTDHSKKHLPNRTWIAQANAGRMADRMGIAIDEALSMGYTGEMLAHFIVEQVFIALSNGEIELKLSDGLAAAKFLADLELRNRSGIDATTYADLLSATIAVFRDSMNYEDFQNAMWMLGGNPNVQNLIHLLDAEHGERVLSYASIETTEVTTTTTQTVVTVAAAQVPHAHPEAIEATAREDDLLAWFDGA